MSKDHILLEAEMSMEKSVDYMVHEFAAVRTGKASPGLVENVDVHAYGSTMKLKQLALITTPEARLLVVQPFDAGTVQDIEKALKESKIGIMPAVDGKIIRLPIPELSEERRKELVRSLSKMAEEARVRVRANRRAALDEAKEEARIISSSVCEEFRLVSDRETFPAGAVRDGVRVGNLKAAFLQVFAVIEDRAADKKRALGIDNQPDI